MAPKQKPSTDSLKQKSLTSFFSKPSATTVTATPASKPAPFKTPAPKTKPLPVSKEKDEPGSSNDASKTSGSSSPHDPKTPHSRLLNAHALTLSAAPSSVASSRIASTPPTSDPIDVDMLASDDEEAQAPSAKSVTQSRQKRKVVIEDSDDESNILNGRRKAAFRSSSPTDAIRSQAKKPRLSQVISDEEDEADDDMKTNFSQRLSRFKKSPVKKGKASSRASSDDDDFIVPDDSEEELYSKSAKSSSRRSSMSSRRSTASSDDEEDLDLDDDLPKKSKPKGKATTKSAGSKKSTKAAGGAGSGGTFNFLTAAEQREQGKKDEKKAAESPYGFLQDVRDKDGRKPGDPNYDPRTLLVPKSAWASFTPFEKQFWEIKQNHYDTILFFQKGKFFELYEDDARIGHQEFDLKLTERVKMCMVGVPESSFNMWASKFLAKGYKVGRVEQAETALGAEMRMAAEKEEGKGKAKSKAKTAAGGDKIVRRELNKVYTNGTLVDAELLTDEQAGHCVSIVEATTASADGSDPDSERKFGICILDCATSEFNLSLFEDDVCRTRLETLMRQIRPKELLFKKVSPKLAKSYELDLSTVIQKGSLSTNTQRLLKTVLPSGCLWTSLRPVEGFQYEETLDELKSIYPPGPGEDVTMDEGDASYAILPESVPPPIRNMGQERLAIEALGSMIWYLRQLNIDKEIMSMKNFNIYDPMKKGMGLTLDGQTLAHLEVLLNNEGGDDGSLLKLLGRCVTPFGKRLFRIWLCMPLRETPDINARLDAVQDIMNHPTFEATFTEVAKGLPDLERIVSRIHAKSCRVKDFLKVLKAFRKLSKGMVKLADESETFESKTIFGLLRGAPDLLPNLQTVESMFEPAGDEKTDELIPRDGKDERYDEVVEEINSLEKNLEDELKKMEKSLGLKLAYWHSAIGNKEIYLVETSSTVDKAKIPKDWTKSGGTKAKNRYVVGSLQKRVRQLKEARENRSTAIKAFKFRLYAEFDTDRALWLRAIRVFSELDCLFSLAKSSMAIGEPSCRPEFVENEALLDFQELRHPTLCLNTSLRDFIPNDVKIGGDVGKIVLLTGPNMACKILRNATPRSLVILDELGRGTSTFDGMAIASAVLHELSTHTLPLSFFATHYGSLTDDHAYHPNIRTMYMSTLVDDAKHELVFLYKLVNGVAESSFGTHVANLAGVPLDVVQRADIISKDFAEKFKEKLQIKQEQQASARMPLVAQADFAYLYKLGTGQLQLPEDPIRSKEALSRMKDIVRRYVQARPSN
ncbi:hypothetical protein NLJ89_g10297 [Agrocybe chaxingu]|uniref:DNA mismatch repair protein n=1 Tax=Agrocybe chaxingu TaxID=84603 RepID=A0A9W8MSS1_9AGAR|nr:hypothetical protein NLJ89_g10297 [Agrocybe chaxingu]